MVRRLLPWLCLVVLVVVAGMAWLTWRGLQARDALTAARTDVTKVRSELLAHHQTQAAAALDAASREAQRAADLTSDPVWRVAGALPFLGRTPRVVTEVSRAAVTLTTDVLGPLVAAAGTLDPQTLRQGDQVQLGALTAAGPQVRQALARLESVEADVAALPSAGVPGTVRDPVGQFRTELATTRASLASVADAVRLLPPMLGGQATRRYLVVFQNNAEARATGGLVGAFGEIEASGGRVRLLRLGSDAELRSAAAPPVDLGPAYTALFGTDPGLWQNTNLSAHEPSGARLQLALWRKQFGEQLDGVIATDPVTLGYLLAVTGPAVTADGEPVTGADVATLTMSTIYARYPRPGQDAARRAELLRLAGAALDRLLSGAGRASDLLTALGRAAGERRLLVYSTRPDEEAVLATTALGGVVDDAPGPYAGLAIDNAAGNKLDFYLERSLDYRVTGCGPDRTSTISVALRNGAPASGLPAYVTYRQDRGPLGSPAAVGDGSNKLDVLVYTATGASLRGATLDGAPVTLAPGTDGAGRPVFRGVVELAPGQQRQLVLHLGEPGGGGDPVVWVAPLVRSARTTVEVESCR